MTTLERLAEILKGCRAGADFRTPRDSIHEQDVCGETWLCHRCFLRARAALASARGEGKEG